LPVLIVDDDESIRTLFTTALERAGIGSVAVAGGVDALNYLLANPVSVVLLDTNMPGMSGLEVLAALREARPTRTLPVILVTGLGDLEDRVHGLESGANDYITKPVEIDELVARVRAQMRDRSAWHEVLEPLRRRAMAVEALTNLPIDSTVEQISDAICAAFAAECDDAATFSFLFGSDRLAVPVAVHGTLGSLVRVGEPLSPAAASLVYALALDGPRLQDHMPLALRDPTSPDLGDVFQDPATFHVLAPITRQRELLGILGMVAPAEVFNPTTRAELLAAAVDFATVAGALLGTATDTYASNANKRSGLERMILQREFAVHYQPVVHLDTREVVGYEALTRWDDGTSPEVPFRDAHLLGLGVECERVTIEKAIADASALPERAWLSVNVSPSTVVDDPTLGEVFERANRRVMIELTEHHPIEDYPRLLAALERLGVDLAVDDAGAGYASLHHILELRPDLVKIDLGWTRGIEGDSVRQAMVRGLTHFTAIAGCELVAEGVETEAEYESLLTLDVTMGQGYLFGRPAPPETFA
jgi:EAL domain-containing protein (putative c-di-GMP-specific phosphodiesterase class I)/CheY-like chemotaxis protein